MVCGAKHSMAILHNSTKQPLKTHKISTKPFGAYCKLLLNPPLRWVGAMCQWISPHRAGRALFRAEFASAILASSVPWWFLGRPFSTASMMGSGWSCPSRREAIGLFHRKCGRCPCQSSISRGQAQASGV